MTESESMIQIKVQAVTEIVTMLVTDDKLRERFLEDAPRTLEELGVKIKDPDKLSRVSEDLKEIIKEHVAVYGSLIDPIGPAADVTIGAAITTGAVTGVTTGVATGVVSWTDDLTAPGKPRTYDWDVIELDFGRVRIQERLRDSEVKIAKLELALAQERSTKAEKPYSDRPRRRARSTKPSQSE